jgi:hypothetical protein
VPSSERRKTPIFTVSGPDRKWRTGLRLERHPATPGYPGRAPPRAGRPRRTRARFQPCLSGGTGVAGELNPHWQMALPHDRCPDRLAPVSHPDAHCVTWFAGAVTKVKTCTLHTGQTYRGDRFQAFQPTSPCRRPEESGDSGAQVRQKRSISPVKRAGLWLVCPSAG